jgi:hypothetical protein
MKTLATMVSEDNQHRIELQRLGTKHFIAHYQGDGIPTILAKWKHCGQITSKHSQYKLKKFVEALADPKVITFKIVEQNNDAEPSIH